MAPSFFLHLVNLQNFSRALEEDLIDRAIFCADGHLQDASLVFAGQLATGQLALSEHGRGHRAAAGAASQGCLDAVNDACIWGAPSEYGVVSFADHVIRPLAKEIPWFTFGNYGIECDYKDNGEINLLVVYCPPRFE